MHPGRNNVLGKFQKHFLLSGHWFCVFKMCCIGQQTSNHLGNTEETLTLNVSWMFPCLRTQATHFEDAEYASRKQKCFASFPFANPYNIVSHIDSKCFCSNVSSFALTFRRFQKHVNFCSRSHMKFQKHVNFQKCFTKLKKKAYEF